MTVTVTVISQQLTEFEQILSQVDSFTNLDSSSSQLKPIATELPTESVPQTSVTHAKGTTSKTCTRAYASPKGKEAVNAVRASSIPVKTREQTDWSVRV